MVEKVDGSTPGDGDESHGVGDFIPSSTRQNFTEKGRKPLNSFMCGGLSHPTEKNAVRRKIDWRIMPLAAWACGLQFVDKVRGLDIRRNKETYGN